MRVRTGHLFIQNSLKQHLLSTCCVPVANGANKVLALLELRLQETDNKEASKQICKVISDSDESDEDILPW